jgi:hypothetical protein
MLRQAFLPSCHVPLFLPLLAFLWNFSLMNLSNLLGFLVEGDEARSSHYIMTTSSGSSFPAVDLMQQGMQT